MPLRVIIRHAIEKAIKVASSVMGIDRLLANIAPTISVGTQIIIPTHIKRMLSVDFFSSGCTWESARVSALDVDSRLLIPLPHFLFCA
jgi:hypothetical protein